MAKNEILIVEDNPSKQVEIERALMAVKRKVFAVRSITGAFRLVTEQAWDLIILDMTFQVDGNVGFESSRQATAGIELLQFLSRRRIAIPVIVATQHDFFSSPEVGEINGIVALDRLLREAFPRNYRGVVKVDQSEDAWKEILLVKVRKIIE